MAQCHLAGIQPDTRPGGTGREIDPALDFRFRPAGIEGVAVKRGLEEQPFPLLDGLVHRLQPELTEHDLATGLHFTEQGHPTTIRRDGKRQVLGLGTLMPDVVPRTVMLGLAKVGADAKGMKTRLAWRDATANHRVVQPVILPRLNGNALQSANLGPAAADLQRAVLVHGIAA